MEHKNLTKMKKISPLTNTHAVENNLAHERSLSKICADDFSDVIYDKQTLQHLQYVLDCMKYIQRDDPHQISTYNSQQLYMYGCKLAQQLVSVIKQHKIMQKPYLSSLFQALGGPDSILNLHLTMFVPALETLCSDEQKKYWLPLAYNFNILGTYSQTEIGHGSYVPGLETTATFDYKSDSFVVCTPTLTSTKWWPGGLAKSATHCVLMARMIIHGVDYGVQAFIMQVRDLNTHKTLEGIKLKHIGQKLGYNSMDNGAMQIDNVYIPRTNLMMKYVKVDRDGNFSKVGNQKMLYATMTYTRKQIIWGAGFNLAKAVVIAIRYSITRRQFPEQLNLKNNEIFKNVVEAPVMDYSTQQFMLFPLLSTSIGYFICGRWVNDKYDKFMEEANTGNFTDLSEIHCLTSSLKAAMTYNIINAIEVCRKSAGGHGYLMSAGLAMHLANFLPQATYEGDFVVLSIQTGRLLLKCVQNKMMGKTPTNTHNNSLNYIYEFDPFNIQKIAPNDNQQHLFTDPNWLLSAYKQRSNMLIYKAAKTFQIEASQNDNIMNSLDSVKIDFTFMSKAHTHVIVLEQFQKHIESFKNKPEIYEVMSALCNLYALYWMYESFGEFVVADTVVSDNYDVIMKNIRFLMGVIRPHVVSLTDAFKIPDYILNSTIGEYDGEAYHTLYNSTHYETLNETDVSEAYYKHLQYILHPHRALHNTHTHSKL